MEFTFIIENNNDCDFSELYDYLYSLNGIEDVVITNDDLITIDTKYNDKLINDEIIKLEILTFLNLMNYPCIYGFDRHSKNNLILIKKDYQLCCEFCFGNIIYPLIETKGIIKVESNFYKKYWKENDHNYYVNIYYDPKLITKKDLDKLMEEIDRYG